MVCLTWQTIGAAHQIVHVREAEPILRGWLEDPNVLLVGHNVAYDCAVVSEEFPHLRDLIFKAYEEDRITCTKWRQALLDIASGTYRRKHLGKGVFVKQTYDLEQVAKRHGFIVQKDAWRMSYGEFLNVPLSRWHEHAPIVQAKGRARLEELTRSFDGKDKKLAKEIEGLREMVNGDPSRVTTYPLEDATATLTAYLGQERHAAWLDDQFRQACAYFSLHLFSAHGARTDEYGVSVLERETLALIEELEDELIQLGLVREDGTRDTKIAKRRMIEVCKEDGAVIPRTKTHTELKDNPQNPPSGKCCKLDGTVVPDGSDDCEEHVCLDAEACELSDDEVLQAYAEYSMQKKVLSNDVKALIEGIRWPVHTTYGLAETGRTTSSKPNIQNVTKRPGLRECYIARAGFLFAQCDYPTLELYTLAQCCLAWLGQSKLAEALNGGLDAHLWFAASMLGVSYDEADKRLKDKDPELKKTRQLAKAANFGFPGGMGVAKFVRATRKAVLASAKEEGKDPFATWEALGLNEKRARKLKDEWFVAFPEMPHYFARINALCDNVSSKATVETLYTKRTRGQASYCAAANNGFQGLASDCAKRAAWLIAKAQYVERTSPLFNSRTVFFVHDEFIAEVRDDERAHDAAYELGRLMAVAANKYLPDVPIPLEKMVPVLMKRWSKKAESVFNANGRLVAWSP